MIVIDVGCMVREGETSVENLIERFHPELLFGFDPGLPRDIERSIDGCDVVLWATAAWTHNGYVEFVEAGAGGIRSHVFSPAGDRQEEMVQCVDLSEFIRDLPIDDIVLKLDCEGSEYELIPHLTETGAIHRLSLLLVEFHDLDRGGVTPPPESVTSLIPIEWEDWNA